MCVIMFYHDYYDYCIMFDEIFCFCFPIDKLIDINFKMPCLEKDTSTHVFHPSKVFLLRRYLGRVCQVL